MTEYLSTFDARIVGLTGQLPEVGKAADDFRARFERLPRDGGYTMNLTAGVFHLRLLQDRPDAIGLAVPGMPYGSPGMGDESARDAYDVFLIAREGTTSVFTSYPVA